MNPFDEDHLSPCCGKDVGISKHPTWGWICHECEDEYDRLDRETDWDQYEADKRERIAESNEY